MYMQGGTMPAESIELGTLNNTDLPQSCLNGGHYSSLDKPIKPDAQSINQEDKTKDDDTLTDFQGLMLLGPTFIGIGFLGLPYMVKLLGLWAGSGGLLFYGYLNEFTILILCRSTQLLTNRTGERFSDIGKVVEMSMKLGPSCLQHHSGKFKFVMNCSILLNCGLLIPDLISVMNLFAKDALHPYVEISDTLSIAAISVLLIPLFLTRRMKLLSRLTTAGSIALLGMCIITFQYICRDIPDNTTRPAIKRFDFIAFTSFTNDVMFSNGGIVLIIPIRDRMKIRKNFDGWNGLLGFAWTIMISIHVGAGFFGYLKTGEMTQVNFILNLPSDIWIYKSLKILSILILYCTLGMNVFVIVELVWSNLKDRTNKECFQKYGEYICRIMLLIICCTFTMLVPEYQQLMSLTGCFGSIYQGLIVPPIITMLTFYGEEAPTLLADKVDRKVTLLLCVLVLVFRIYSLIAGMCVAVYTTVNHIVL